MLEIGKTIVSFDVLEKHFLCDLMKCKGACCVDGASGAPLTKKEAATIKELYPLFKENMQEEGIEIAENVGFSMIDSDGDLVTPLMSNEACIYVFEDEHGITKCGIEKAFREGKIDFRKPISCYLFPIRVTEYSRFDAVNYEQIDICSDARRCGGAEKVPVYQFLKQPLIEKYGKGWFDQLEYAATHRPWEKE
ncbi:MAG: DUF3109 family protein [Mangrovibacterium sp.]